ncbi:hypothetical protein ACFV6Z_13860 [Streptomyces sp. NPDC059818]|uniref:hypothetical protein n=1 Tax=Streptomyces sp. NPDC059818 TaxID=3346962 RepID=UPI003662F293
MTDVFINYRTGDGEKTATLIDQELSRRFGSGRIFRASKSITPGQAYPETLLTKLRQSTVLLAVIGPDWTNFRVRLGDPEDWVRKELLEASPANFRSFPYWTAGRPTGWTRTTCRRNWPGSPTSSPSRSAHTTPRRG